MEAAVTALNSHVLVLNKMWMAVRVVDARRAFALLCKDLAEVIRVDDGSYTGYDFGDWADLSEDYHSLFGQSDEQSGGEDAYEWVRTVRMNLAVPKVIRLLAYDRLPRNEVKLNRRNIFARDHNRCQYCGGRFASSDLSLDHVIPRSQGGGASWANLVCCCVKCNTRKGGRTPRQASMPLIKKPVKPKTNPILHMRLGSGKYESWKAFLDNAYWSVELK